MMQVSIGRYRLVRSATVGVLTVVGALARGPAAPQAGASPDFTRDVQPILAGNCVRCHGGSEAQGKLRLDTREGLLRGGASGPVVLPGNGKGSPLYQRLVAADPA